MSIADGGRRNAKWMVWTGWLATVAPALMLVASGVMKVLKPPMVVEEFTKQGFNPDILVVLGLVEIACTVLYVVPQTAVLGAILLTGYLGGAIATHVRPGEPFVVPLAIGVVIWFGLYLREARIRALIPLRG